MLNIVTPRSDRAKTRPTGGFAWSRLGSARHDRQVSCSHASASLGMTGSIHSDLLLRLHFVTPRSDRAKTRPTGGFAWSRLGSARHDRQYSCSHASAPLGMTGSIHSDLLLRLHFVTPRSDRAKTRPTGGFAWSRLGFARHDR